MNRNGTIEQVPTSKVGGIGLWLVSRLVLAVVLFKIMAFAWLGEARYQENVDRLSAGTLYERAGAWVMQADAVTRKLASFIMPVIG